MSCVLGVCMLLISILGNFPELVLAAFLVSGTADHENNNNKQQHPAPFKAKTMLGKENVAPQVHVYKDECTLQFTEKGIQSAPCMRPRCVGEARAERTHPLPVLTRY